MIDQALSMIELKSIAKGIFVADQVIKKSNVKIVEAHAICPGKYMFLFSGNVGDVVEGHKEGVLAAGDMIVNDFILPKVAPQIIPAISGNSDVKNFKSIAIVETFSIVSAVLSADMAVKESEVFLVEMRLAQGLGGKGYFVLTGDLPDLEAAIDKATQYLKRDGMLADLSLIENPHPELIDKALYW